MATPTRVQTLRSSVKGQRPTTGSREVGEIYVNFPDRQFGVVDAGKAALDMVAVRFFSSTTDYAAGDFVWQAGNIYRAKAAVPAGAFNPAQWDRGAGTPADLLATLLTVDGTGSGLDADLLDGQSGAYYLAWANFTGKPTTFPPTLPINESDVTNLVSDLAAKASTTYVNAQNAAQDTTISAKADRTYVDTQDALLAPKASPIFTGDPRAPTPSTADNDTSVATTAFVKAQAYLVDAPNDGLTYGRKSAAWATIVGGAVVSDTTPPGPLQPGQLWWESDTGNTFIWYDDGSGTQWVQQNVSVLPANVVTATAETRNRVVNGAMQISQEAVNTAGGNNWYAADQWQGGFGGAGVASFQRVQVTTPNGSANRLRCTVTTADASITGTDILYMYQKLEGTRMADFRWGSPSARQVVLRFGFKAPAGTYTACLQAGATGLSYLANFTISAAQAGTDTEQVLVIPGTTFGPWAIDTALGMTLNITLAAGPTYQGVVGWQGGSLFGTASTSNGFGVVNNTFELFDVGLYLDPLATGVPPAWTMPDEAQEEIACKRYWQKVDLLWAGNVTTAAAYFTKAMYQVPPRIVPAAASLSAGASSFPAVSGTLTPTSVSVQENRTANATANGGYFSNTVAANARM
jgi:hypothetical protein